MHPVAVIGGDRLGDMKGDINADFVKKTHWTHRHAEVEHGLVQIRDGRAGFEKISGFDEVRHQNAVDHEAGTVFDNDWQFADLLYETQRTLQNFGRSLTRGDDFNQLHSMNRIEEMQTEDTLRLMSAGRQFRDRQG